MVFIVVDGTNLACEGRPGGRPSIAQLVDQLDCLCNESGNARIQVFLDRSTRHRIDESENALFLSLLEHGHRQVNVSEVASGHPADEAILQLASDEGAVVVSNDNFTDYQGFHPWLLDADRRLGASQGSPRWEFMPRTAPLQASRPLRRTERKSPRGVADSERNRTPDSAKVGAHLRQLNPSAGVAGETPDQQIIDAICELLNDLGMNTDPLTDENLELVKRHAVHIGDRARYMTAAKALHRHGIRPEDRSQKPSAQAQQTKQNQARSKGVQPGARPHQQTPSDRRISDSSQRIGALGADTSSVEHRLSRFAVGVNDGHIRAMLGLLENEHQRVLVVEAGLGTAKSTVMLYRLLVPPEGCFRLCDLGPIVVVTPHDVAAVSIAQFVGNELSSTGGVGRGHQVGYEVPGDRNFDSSCQLIYVKDDNFVDWIRSGRLFDVGTIVLDEVNERTPSNAFVLKFLKENLHRFPGLRVLVTSSFLYPDFYVDHFLTAPGAREAVGDAFASVNKFFVPSLWRVGFGFPLFPDLDQLPRDQHTPSAVARWNTACPDLPLRDSLEEESFIAGNWELLEPLAPASDLDEGLQHDEDYPKVREITRKLLPYRFSGPPVDSREWIERMPALVSRFAIDLVKGLDVEDISGDVLAFLPTMDAIDEACELIRAAVGDRAHVCAVHMRRAEGEIREVLDGRRLADKRMIVVSSDLAEKTLYVQSARFVIDSGMHCDEKRISEPEVTHTQAGIRRRWSRVGRTVPGWVFPLYTKEQFLSFANERPLGNP